MKKKLLDFCSKLGIEYVGIAPSKPYEELRVLLERRINEGHNSSFEESDIEKRINPNLELKSARSVIVCLFPYYKGFDEDGNISNYTYAVDYHITAKKKLAMIGEYLKSCLDNFEYVSHVDTGPLPDRYLGNLAGLGFYGINSHLINEQYGTYTFIGYILCSYLFEPDKPLERTCIKCGACVKACPGGAILGDFTINPYRCKSFLTQKKGDLEEEEINIINKSKLVFGCDICQKVCPHNRCIQETNLVEFKENLITKLDMEEIKGLSNKEFKKKYGDRAFSWRGRNIILRNFEYVNRE